MGKKRSGEAEPMQRGMLGSGRCDVEEKDCCRLTGIECVKTDRKRLCNGWTETEIETWYGGKRIGNFIQDLCSNFLMHRGI